MDHQLVLIAGAGLAITIAAAVFSRRTGVATPLLLVGFGIAASYLPGTPEIQVEPELVLAGILPLLLYASAVQMPVLDLRRNLGLIGWLSVVLVIVSAVAIGYAVHAVVPAIGLPLGIALGAVVSPTDAVAATAIGRRVGLPARLLAVLEGESLVNDASALVVLRTAIVAIGATGEVGLVRTGLAFGWAVVGAVLVGLAVAWLTVPLRRRLDDPVLNTTISFAVPFLAYLPAEEVGASGVLAVVVAGVVTGRLGAKGFSSRDRMNQATTWATVSFVLENAVFLAMGYQLPTLVADARGETSVGELSALVALTFGVLVAIRFLGLAWPMALGRPDPARTEKVTGQLAAFEDKLDTFEPEGERATTRLEWARRRLARGRADLAFEEREPLGRRGYLVIAWAGMRGVVTVAAAQTIPPDTPHRATVVLAAYLVALVTLVLFGLTLPGLIRRLDFSERTSQERRDDFAGLLEQIAGSAADRVGPLEDVRIEGEPVDVEVLEQLRERSLPRMLAGISQVREAKPDQAAQTALVQRRYLDAMRDALFVERSIGAYSTETYRRVEQLLDQLEQRIGAMW